MSYEKNPVPKIPLGPKLAIGHIHDLLQSGEPIYDLGDKKVTALKLQLIAAKIAREQGKFTFKDLKQDEIEIVEAVSKFLGQKERFLAEVVQERTFFLLELQASIQHLEERELDGFEFKSHSISLSDMRLIRNAFKQHHEISLNFSGILWAKTLLEHFKFSHRN